MSARQRALDEAALHCDVKQRLMLLPPAAKTRGLYFRSIDSVLGDAGHGERYRALFPEQFKSVLWYPSSEFMVRLVVAGSLLTEPTRVHEGMYQIGLRNAQAFGSSLLGRAMFRLLSRDPKRLLLQGDAARRQSSSYGRWEFEFPSPTSALVRMYEEYMYIESFYLGAAVGTFAAIGLEVRATAELQDPFRGLHRLNWG